MRYYKRVREIKNQTIVYIKYIHTLWDEQETRGYINMYILIRWEKVYTYTYMPVMTGRKPQTYIHNSK